jgi:hypothetical protein
MTARHLLSGRLTLLALGSVAASAQGFEQYRRINSLTFQLP